MLRDGVHRGRRFPVELSRTVAEHLHEATRRVGEALQAEACSGLVRVYAMPARDETFYPCQEINARFNMLTCQSRIAERLIPDGTQAIAATIGLRLCWRHTFGEVARALRELLLDGASRSAC